MLCEDCEYTPVANASGEVTARFMSPDRCERCGARLPPPPRSAYRAPIGTNPADVPAIEAYMARERAKLLDSITEDELVGLLRRDPDRAERALERAYIAGRLRQPDPKRRPFRNIWCGRLTPKTRGQRDIDKAEAQWSAEGWALAREKG